MLLLLASALAGPLLIQAGDLAPLGECSDVGFYVLPRTVTDGGKVDRFVDVVHRAGSEILTAEIPLAEVAPLIAMFSEPPPASSLSFWERRDSFGDFTFAAGMNFPQIRVQSYQCNISTSERESVIAALRTAADMAAK